MGHTAYYCTEATVELGQTYATVTYYKCFHDYDRMLQYVEDINKSKKRFNVGAKCYPGMPTKEQIEKDYAGMNLNDQVIIPDTKDIRF